MRSLRQIKDILSIRIIVGPLFSMTLAKEIREQSKIGRHSFEILENQEDLSDHIYWCDVAISASGLTK